MLQHLLNEAKNYPKNLKGRENAPLNRRTEDSFIQFQLRPKVKYSQIPEKVPGFEFKTIQLYTGLLLIGMGEYIYLRARPSTLYK